MLGIASQEGFVEFGDLFGLYIEGGPRLAKPCLNGR